MRKILFLAANPEQTSRLRLDQESREIGEALRRAKESTLFDLEQRRTRKEISSNEYIQKTLHRR